MTLELFLYQQSSTVPTVESTNVQVHKKVWCRRDPAPNVMMISKLIREVKGHKPITFREFVFLFRKPANVCFTSSYTFLQSPLDQYFAYPKYMIHI